jgi:lysophospholipid acyltransferase (LPLAT)-like uncharacterized protein
VSRAGRLQVGALGAYLRCVNRTTAVEVDVATPESALVTFWHDAIFCVLAATFGMKDVGIYIRAQPHIEDTLDLMERLGVRTFVSDHKNAAGVKEAREWLGVPGRLLAVTLDGGTARVAMPGVVRLARMLKVPLHPLSVSASSGYRMGGWDRLVVPHAGGRLSVRALPAVPTDDPEADALVLQRAMPEPTLAPPSPGARVPWGRHLEVWPRLCLMPLTRGKLKVWPAREPRTVFNV